MFVFSVDNNFLLILLQTLIVGIIAREVPELTFFVRNSSNKIEPICIADKNVLDSAIGWSYPIEDVKDKLPVIVSKFVPELENDYSCDFLKTRPCSNLWQMENWQFSKFDSHKFKPVLDGRWEDFPTLLTSNSVKEFLNRVDIPHPFELGISIRTAGIAEVFLCTGWNPHSYPCYYLSIGGQDDEQAFLRKYKTFPITVGKNDTKLTNYTMDGRLLSENEWKHFVVSQKENGTLSLMGMFQNETLLNYYDSKPIQPIYLFIRSKDTKALWKIYTSHYIFTNKPKMMQLGPTFTIYGDTLCVSLYVSLCRYCKISFYVMINNEKQIMTTVTNENVNDDLFWKKIRLVQHDLVQDKIKLFVETKFINNTSVSDGFWGIDDIRGCSEDEIKVSHLVGSSELGDSDLSNIWCQALTVPTWRPHQNNFANNQDEVNCTSTTTTIQILRKSNVDGHEEHQILQHYVIQYEGKDLCTEPGTVIKNRFRLKSQGFLIARSTKSIIKDLIPYTTYTITIWNVINDIKMVRQISTLPTDLPTNPELPTNVTIQTTGTTCEIMWDPPKCNETFGPNIYQVKVYVNNGTLSSTQTDYTTHYSFKELLPSVNYQVEIRTARKLENLNDFNLSIVSLHNCTTYAHVAVVVEHLEVYATTKNSAQLRFDVPNNLAEKPDSAQVRWCHPLLYGKCNSDIRELVLCKLWPQKFCITMNNLTTGINYTFFVSLRSKATYSSGEEVNVSAVITEKVPGVPLNVSYKMQNCVKTVDCCHLNVSWIHPNIPNGSITMFDVILTESSYSYVLDSFKNIHEVLQVNEARYQPVYSYKVKYISCKVPYKILVRAINDHFKGPFASTSIEVDEQEDYVDPMPKYVNSTNETVSFKLPQRETDIVGANLFIVVQDYNRNITNISSEVTDLEMFDSDNELCNRFGDTWIAKAIMLNETTSPVIVIGDSSLSYMPQLNRVVFNKPLMPDTEYCFTFTLTKKFNSSEHIIVYHDKNLFTERNYVSFQFQDGKVYEGPSVATYLLPVLFMTLLIVCGAWLSYRYFKKRRYGTSGEHIYESMPFEDYLTDAITNDTYDRLSHE